MLAYLLVPNSIEPWLLTHVLNCFYMLFHMLVQL